MAYSLRQHARTKYTKVESPSLMVVTNDHGIAIDSELDRVLDNFAFVDRRYSHLPSWLLTALIKLLSYPRGNLLVRAAAWIAHKAVKLDLTLNGRSDAMPHFVRGLSSAKLTARNRKARAQSAESYGSNIGYDNEEHDLSIALRYKAWVNSTSHLGTQEERIGTQFHFAIENTAQFLANHPEIKRFINFGACYGLVDYELAKRLPNVQFFGVDRALSVKHFNDDEFSAPNLEFVAAKITDFLDQAGDLNDAAFFHMRTMMIFPEAFVSDLFRRLSSVRAVVGIEPYGYLMQERGLYEFSSDPKPSALFRTGMYIHNYPAWAASIGLGLVAEKWLTKPNLPKNESSTNRIYAYIAYRH